MSQNDGGSRPTMHNGDHDPDNDEDRDDDADIDNFNFPLPPSAVPPLSIRKNDVSVGRNHFPGITLDPSGAPLRFPRVPTRSRRPRLTLRTFEDLREYSQNRAQMQNVVDRLEQPRTLFRNPDTEGNVAYNSTSSPEGHTSRNSPRSVLGSESHDSRGDLNTNAPEHGSLRQGNRNRAINRQSSPEPELMNEPEAHFVNETNPFQHPQGSLNQINLSGSHRIPPVNNAAQDLSSFMFHNYNSGQDVNTESQYELDDWTCTRQETMRPTDYPELFARDTAGSSSAKLYLDFWETPRTQYEHLPPRGDGELQLAPIRGLNIRKNNSQQNFAETHAIRHSLNDTHEPQPSVSTPRRLSTSSFSSYCNRPTNFSKPFSASSEVEEFNFVRSATESSFLRDEGSVTPLANVSSPYTSEYEPREERRPSPRSLHDRNHAQESGRQEIFRHPKVPEKAHLNPFSNKPSSSVSFENDDSSGQTVLVPGDVTSPRNNPGYLSPMWVGSGGYTSSPRVGAATSSPRVGAATHNASTMISFGSGEGTSSILNFPSPPASTSRLSSPDNFTELDNSSKTIIMSTGERSSESWMSWRGIRGKISSGRVWPSRRDKNGQKPPSNPETTATKTGSPALVERTKKLVKNARHLRGGPRANSTSADPINGGRVVKNVPEEEASEALLPPLSGQFPIAESSGDGARRSAGLSALGDNSVMGDSSNPHPPQPVEPDTTEVVSSTTPSGRVSAFCSESLTILSKIWNVGIKPNFSKLKRKVTGGKAKPQPVYMRGARESLTPNERIRYTMGLGGRERRRAPDGEGEGTEMTPITNAPESSLRSLASSGHPPNNPYNPRNSDEVETRRLADPVRDTIAARDSKGLWSSTNAAKPKPSTRERLRKFVGIKSKTGSVKGKSKSTD